MDARRLSHISDLPNNLHYLPLQIKHLLPVHHPSLIDNVNTILYHHSQSHQWPLYLDPSLTIAHGQYEHMVGGWCQDIDGQQHHLKASLELSAIVLNYLHSLLQSSMAKEQDRESGQVVKRVDHIGANPKPSNLSFPLALAYNIYKTKDKHNNKKLIFIVGHNKSSPARLYALLNSIRCWNLKRLKSQICQISTPTRLHKHVEHLLTILRSFMTLEEEDHQVKKRQLQMIAGKLDCQNLPKELPREGLQDCYVVIITRFQWVFRGAIGVKDIDMMIAEVLYELLKIMPMAGGCSYVSKCQYEPKLNQLVLLWLTTHKATKSHKIASQADLQAVLSQATAFSRRKTLDSIRDTTPNIADEMIRSSIKVLSRYTPDNSSKVKEWAQTNSNLNISRIRSNSIKSNVFTQKSNKQTEKMSVLSKVSFRDTQSVRDGRAKMEAQFQSLSSPLMAHRDREYSSLLAVIKAWESIHGHVPAWPEMRTAIRKNCQTAKMRHSGTTLNSNLSQLLLSLLSIRNYLDLDQHFLLLKYHSQYRQSLFQILFQPSSYPLLRSLGIKIAKEYAQSLYEHYLTREFRIERANLLTLFMKRMVRTYACEDIMPKIAHKIDVGLLIQLLEGRQLLGEKYRMLAGGVLGDIFAPSQTMQMLCPILMEIFYALADDHHEQLLNGLLADLTYECLYFPHELTISNSPYKQDTDLRQKKVLELLREGGFNTLGYELRNTLKPVIVQYANYTMPASKIYQEININKPSHLGRVVQLLATSTFVQNYPEVVSHFEAMKHTANNVTKPVSNAYLLRQIDTFQWDKELALHSADVLKSESGIFKQLLQYNPQLKLAGRQLSQVLASHSKTNSQPPERYDTERIIQTIFPTNLQEIYQYIVMASKLKEKYERYEQLRQDQRIYLREIVHQILCHKVQIHEYLELGQLVKRAGRSECPALF